MSRLSTERSGLPDLLMELAMASGVGYLAATYTVSRWLTRPTRGKPRRTPGDLGLPWERLDCRTADNHRLVGWVVEPPRTKATIVLFHGIRNTREQTLGRCAFLAAAGYRCVSFDHRAHGESTGRCSSFGYHESRDVAAVLDLVRRRWPSQPWAALGISMGAAAICYAAPRVNDWGAVILESLYYDIASAFSNRIQNDYPPWFHRLSKGVVWVTERRLGLKLAQLTPAEHIGHLRPTPVLLLTGTADVQAPPAEAQSLYERCQGPRELWLVPSAGHRDVFETGGKVYEQRILDFLTRRLAA